MHDAAPNPASRPERLAWVDVAKGVGAFLVVLEHVLGGLIASHILSEGLSQAFYDSIFQFLMPMFMALSGMFLERSLRRGLTGFTAERLRSLYYPAVLWGAAYWASGMLFRRYINTAPTAWALAENFYDPIAGLWYLKVLLVMSLVFGLLRYFRVPTLVMLGCTTVGVYVCLQRGDTLDSRALTACWYASWLLAGVLAGPRLLEIGERVSIGVLGLAAVGGCLGMVLLLGAHEPGTPRPRPLYAPFGVVTMLAVSILAARLGRARVLTTWGRRSLEIYVASGLGMVGMRLLLTRFLGVTSPWIHLPVDTAAGMAFPLLAVWACERAGFHYAFRFGRPAARA